MDENGATCLHYAVGGASLPVLRYLMDECGFDLSLRTAVSCRVVNDIVLFVRVTNILDHMHLNTHSSHANPPLPPPPTHTRRRQCHTKWRLEVVCLETSVSKYSSAPCVNNHRCRKHRERGREAPGACAPPSEISLKLCSTDL